MRVVIAQSLLLTGLVVLTIFLWQSRFQRLATGLEVTLPELVGETPLADLDGTHWDPGPGCLTLEKAKSQNLTVDLRAAGLPSLSHLHSSFRLQARDLEPCDAPWKDGRLTILWTDQEGKTESEYLGSARWSECTEVVSVVSSPDDGHAHATIRLEHMGKSGQLQLENLSLIAVKETRLWKIGHWILLVLWTLWVVGVVGTSVRGWSLALLWVFVATKLILPGPWHNYRPIGQTFNLSPADDRAIQPDIQSIPPIASSAKVTGRELRPQGGILLQLRYAFRSLRPIMHGGLFFALTLLFLLVLRKREVLALPILIALGVELIQLGFGYGADYHDLLDLLIDGTGIAAATALVAIWCRCTKRPLWISNPKTSKFLPA